jgi:uncharacterized protein YceK
MKSTRLFSTRYRKLRNAGTFAGGMIGAGIIVLVLIAALLVSGCTSADEPAEEPAQEETTTETTEEETTEEATQEATVVRETTVGVVPSPEASVPAQGNLAPVEALPKTGAGVQPTQPRDTSNCHTPGSGCENIETLVESGQAIPQPKQITPEQQANRDRLAQLQREGTGTSDSPWVQAQKEIMAKK